MVFPSSGVTSYLNTWNSSSNLVLFSLKLVNSCLGAKPHLLRVAGMNTAFQINSLKTLARVREFSCGAKSGVGFSRNCYLSQQRRRAPCFYGDSGQIFVHVWSYAKRRSSRYGVFVNQWGESVRSRNRGSPTRTRT